MHLDLPEDVALAPRARGRAPRRKPPTEVCRAPSDAAIARAGELIAAARSGRSRCSAHRQCGCAKPDLLRQVIERHDLPFATTTMAKGMIDEDHPLSIGCIERACRQMQRKFLRVGRPDRRARLRHGRGRIRGLDRRRAASADRHREGRRRAVGAASRTRSPAISMHRSHALAALPASHQHLDARTRSPSTGARSRPRCGRPASTFTAHAAIDAVRRALPRDGVLSFDVGAHTHQIASQWTAHAPKTFQITNGWSSMGFGLPGAIAAKLARPDLPVVCLLGDGCFQMTCGEVAIAQAHGAGAADRRARRQVAGADQGQADPPAVSALRHRAAERGLWRAAAALFRRAGGRRPQPVGAGGAR